MEEETPQADPWSRCVSAMLTAWCAFWIFHAACFLVEAVIETDMWLKWDSLPNRSGIPVPHVDPWASLVLIWLVPGMIAFCLTVWQWRGMRGSTNHEVLAAVLVLIGILLIGPRLMTLPLIHMVF